VQRFHAVNLSRQIGLMADTRLVEFGGNVHWRLKSLSHVSQGCVFDASQGVSIHSSNIGPESSKTKLARNHRASWNKIELLPPGQFFQSNAFFFSA
jgi:hypothetical protein